MSLKNRLANWILSGINYDFVSFTNSDGTVSDIDISDRQNAYFSNAFRACLLAKARPLSALPIHIYERKDGIRTEAHNSYVDAYLELLKHKWNPCMTGSEGIRWLDMTKDAIGNAFARIEHDKRGIPVAIYPMQGIPSVYLSDGKIVFEYGGDKFTPAGKYLEHEIIWVKSPIMDTDCVYGRSLAELAAAELNLSIELTDFYSAMISGEAPTSGWLETDSNLTQQSYEKIKAQLGDGAGVVNAGKVRIFDNGLHYKSTRESVVDLNLIEQEKWILQETCRTLSVPPQEVYELSHATYSNYEQGSLNFASKTLVPECVAIEQALSAPLWLNGYRNLNVQLDMNGLLRGSYKERMDGYRIAYSIGMYSPNDLLAKEDEKPFEGGSYHAVSSAYSMIDPETGEVTSLTKSVNNPDPQPGGLGETGEGGRGNTSDSNTATDTGAQDSVSGLALAVVHKDMQERIRDRYASTGDTPKFRDFANRVLAPIAQAYALIGEEYTIEDDVAEIIGD